MSKLFKFMTIAAVGIAIGTVATRLVKTDKVRLFKKTRPATNQDNQLRAKDEKNDDGKDLDEMDNCFI
jgi:hypothetical protein